MAKTKQKEHKSELEHLRKQNRSLIKENNALRRQLKQLEKREHWFENSSDQESTEDTPLNITKCPECVKGNLIYTDYKFVEIYKCMDCGYTKRVRK